MRIIRQVEEEQGRKGQNLLKTWTKMPNSSS